MSEIVSQLPPLTENLPPPIRVRISSGVSLGPFANGVQLRREERPFDLLSCDPAREHLHVAATDEERSNCHRGACPRARWSQSPLLPSSKTEALTLRASYTGELPGSRCHSPRHSLGVLVPEQSKQRQKNCVWFLSLSSLQLVKSGLTPVCIQICMQSF